jgi:hypothetical protein
MPLVPSLAAHDAGVPEAPQAHVPKGLGSASYRWGTRLGEAVRRLVNSSLIGRGVMAVVIG